MVNLREALKEMWGKFRDDHRPHLQMGRLLVEFHAIKAFREWGYENLKHYLENELHMPYTSYVLYLSAAKHVSRFALNESEIKQLEADSGLRKVIRTAKISKNKTEFLDRMAGKYFLSTRARRFHVGPFNFSISEIFRLRRAGRITGHDFDKPSKDEILALADFIVETLTENRKKYVD